MIPRVLTEAFRSKIQTSRFLLVQGPRNCGKETFIGQALSVMDQDPYYIDCDLRKADIEELIQNAPEDHAVIVLNEAQYIENFNELIDSVLRGKFKQTIVASCSFKPLLEDDFLEALKMEQMLFTLFAPTFYEAANHFGLPHEEQLLEERMIYGNYPSVLADLDFAEVTLRALIDGVVETHPGPKDRMNKGEKLRRLMQLLAFGIGEPQTYNDLGERCGLDNETVERYIKILEEAFVVIKLPSFNTEQRYELRKSHCFYFYDNGIRNALISNFNPTDLRNDIPQLWKNYLIAERIKWVRMNNGNEDFYFWRTHTRQQIDLIENGRSELRAYKMDWEKRKKVKVPWYFTELYPDIKVSIVQRNSYWNYLSRKVK